MSINRMVYTGTSYFGEGARKEIGTEIRKRHFQKAFLITDHDLIRCGIAEKIEAVLEENGTPWETDAEVKPNPTIENCQHGVDAFKASGADYLIAIGGGS